MAKKFALSIIFIDEIDAIGKERTGSEFTHYTEGLLNVLLTEMDGFEVDASKLVFVIAAREWISQRCSAECFAACMLLNGVGFAL